MENLQSSILSVAKAIKDATNFRGLIGVPIKKTTSYGAASTTTSDKDITDLTITVDIPAGVGSIKITASGADYELTGGIGTHYGVPKIKESTTVLGSGSVNPHVANKPFAWYVEAIVDAPTTGEHTYKVAFAHNSTGPNFLLGASSAAPLVLYVEAL